MARIRLENIQKKYPNGRQPVKDFSLDIANGERMTLLGPATSGKSTVMKIIAGVEPATEGTVWFNEKPVNERTASERDVAIVSGENLLYPELTVWENIAFGLKLKRMAPEEIERTVEQAMTLLGLSHLSDRMATEVSGIDVYRVLLGRAVARRPSVILLDEPFKSLEVSVKDRLIQDLVSINSRLGLTIVYVTGNSRDAQKLGGRTCVMHRGILQQVGSFEELTASPDTAFVQGYLSEFMTNYIEVTLEDSERGIMGRLDQQSVLLPESLVQIYQLRDSIGQRVQLTLRTDEVLFSRKPGECWLKGRVFAKESHDGVIFWTAKADDLHIISTAFDKDIRLEEQVYINLNLRKATVQFQ